MIVFWNSIQNYLAGYSNTWFLFLFSYRGCKDGGLRSEFWYHVGELIPKILLTLIGNPGKLIQKCFRNFSFPGCDTDGFLENSISGVWAGPISEKFIHQFFVGTYSVYSYLDEFPRNRPVKRPGILWISFFDLRLYFGWIFQKSACVMRHDSCPKILRLTIGRVFQKSV